MSFLYYLPQQSRVTAEVIDASDLRYALEPGHVTTCQVVRGPDGQSGLVIAESSAPATIIGYHEQSQTWRSAPKKPYWVGIDARKKPKPESLKRPNALSGHLVELADGNRWMVPVARAFLEDDGDLRYYCALPHTVDLDEDGHWMVGNVQERYSHLWLIAEKWWDAKKSATVGDSRVSLDFGELHDSALAALQCNYRLGKVECVLLGLFAGSSAVAVLDALIDLPALEDVLKKKADI